jgi:hypothetical protein
VWLNVSRHLAASVCVCGEILYRVNPTLEGIEQRICDCKSGINVIIGV